MIVATWNVNSIRARYDRALAWLERHRPDFVCLQELKTPDDAFPFDAIQALGYHAAVHGQRTYNGVAILSRRPLQDIQIGLPDHAPGDQARLVSGELDGTRFMSVYVPTGARVGSEKWQYKLAWLDAFLAHARKLAAAAPVVIGGDFNIAPAASAVAKPERWQESVLCHPEVRERLRGLLSDGFVDVFRTHHRDGGVYSWWDYRQLAFPKNDGLRIDLVLATENLAASSQRAWVDREERKGSKPSDHAPVLIELDA